MMTALWQRSGPASFAGSELTSDLPAKASEAWQGIYRNGQNIGYAVRRRLVTDEGFRIEYQALLRLEMMGASRVVKTRVTSLTDRWLRLRDFHFRATSGPVSFEVEGEAAGDSLEVRFLPGERTMTVPLEGPVVLPLIGANLVLEVWPMYTILFAQFTERSLTATQQIGIGLSALAVVTLNVWAFLASTRLGIRKLEAL